MARIAYVDHSYHAKTDSTLFLANLLKKHGHSVDFFWVGDWKGGPSVAFDEVSDYDVIIMFQQRCINNGEFYRKQHPNVIYVPMLDAFELYKGPSGDHLGHWNVFQGSKVLSFSSSVHSMATSSGLYSFPIRYYQEPCPNKADFSNGLRGFLWVRNEKFVSWPILSKLLGNKVLFSSLHIHVAPDPGSLPITMPSEKDTERYNITVSEWFEKKEDFIRILERSNVFFAPRFDEGIGQSFLEAMARGQCVIAPDNGTMNEYILNGINGLLYSEKTPEVIDFSKAASCGEIAWQSVREGYLQWVKKEDKLLDFILAPSHVLYEGKYQHPLVQNSVDGVDSIEDVLKKNNFTSLHDILGFEYHTCIFKYYLYKLLSTVLPSIKFRSKFNKYKSRLIGARHCRSLIFRK